MCGIVGYLGNKQAYPILIKGLKALEYRGYDSAGVSLLSSDNLKIYKKAGRVQVLDEFASNKDISGQVGIGHTRWATHGKPNDKNAHPHSTSKRNLSIIHNGIIENYAVLKAELRERGHAFLSDTDTEVLLHLIEEIKENVGCSLEKAVQLALKRAEGAYAIILLSKDAPNKLIAAKKGSPLAIGLGEGEYFLASDATVMSSNIKHILYLDDEQIAICRTDKALEVKTLGNAIVEPYIQELDHSIDAHDKMGYEHYMLKEIFEQPNALKNNLRGRLTANGIHINGILENEQIFKQAERLIIVSCGTSWHAALVAEYFIEGIARVPVEVEYASEFRYRDPIITEKDIIIAISQSGETADTLAALEIAKNKGAFTFGICNVVGSSIARITNAGIYTKAGSEIGVASTKAFTTQLSALAMVAIQLGKLKGTISNNKIGVYLDQLNQLPDLIKESLKCENDVKAISETFMNVSNFLYLGRGANFPIALEGALKLKEISYIHAEGYPAAEMKHGPIALIDEEMPVVVIANSKVHYEKVLSNIQEVKARSGFVIAIVQEGDTEIFRIADAVIEMPAVSEFLSPFISTIPLQLLSYYIAKGLDRDVDKPRNLAKSVTVE